MRQTIAITGANRGIGLELARLRAEQNVIAICRRASPELEQLGVRIESDVELTDERSVRALAERLSGAKIDVLIHNAGILSREELDDLDFDRMRRQFEVNALAPVRLTALLAPSLGRGSKLVLMTSRMGSIADNTSGGMYGYRMSKAALNIAAVSLARDLAERGVAVAILHPGYVRTGMTRGRGQTDPADAARMLWQRIDALTLESSGTFWHANGETLPW